MIKRHYFVMTILPAVAACLFLLANIAHAGDLPLKVEGAWVRAMPPGAANTAAYMTLINTGDTPLRLTGASTPVAKSASPMVTTKKQVSGVEVLGMEDVDALVVPPHGQCELKPGGDHLMIMGLKNPPPHPGEIIKLTLRIDPGAKEITLDVPVR